MTPAYLTVLAEAKPNPMFTEEQRVLVRFVHYSAAVPCCECGRRSKKHWTMSCSFAAHSFPATFSVSLAKSGKVHLPLAPVCTSHLLAPADLPLARKKAKQ